MVADGIVAAVYVESPYAAKPNAVLLAPAYTFLLSNESVAYQFWLNAGSPAWWERLYQPLTHPYVLSRHWVEGQKWTDEAEQSARQKTLLRLLRGLIRRCRSKIYLAMSALNDEMVLWEVARRADFGHVGTGARGYLRPASASSGAMHTLPKTFVTSWAPRSSMGMRSPEAMSRASRASPPNGA